MKIDWTMAITMLYQAAYLMKLDRKDEAIDKVKLVLEYLQERGRD